MTDAEDTIVNIRVLDEQGNFFGGTADIEFKHLTLSDRAVHRGVDVSHQVAVGGLKPAPLGRYQITVTPAVTTKFGFHPQSKFVNLPASGVASVEFEFAKEVGTPPSPIKTDGLTADAVFAALRWRAVLLPPRLLDMPDVRRSVLARRPGVSDLYIVRDEWARYEAGEIAHIENVLKGEIKERLLERTDEQETTTTTEREVSRLDERETQTTDRFELKQEAERDTSLAFHVDGKVDTSGQYGPTHVDTHLGATFDYSVREADRRAVTQARETVARAVSKIEERVREQRVVRTLTRVHSTDKHALDNKQGTDHVVGIYRWVDKIKTVQVFKYPHRLLFEFEVPEPAAFLRWVHARPKTGIGKPPDPFTLEGKTLDGKEGTPLTPDLITAGKEEGKINYLDLAKRYAVQGIAGPPEERMVFAILTHPAPDTVTTDNKPPVFVASSTVAIPDGWEGSRFLMFVAADNAVPLNKPETGWLELVVGTDFPSHEDTDEDPGKLFRFAGKHVFRDMKRMNFRTPVTGQVPIQLATDDLDGLVATVQVFCRPTQATMRAWRFATFDLIQGAYWELRRQQEQAAAQAALQAGITIQGDSPARNAEVVREELKRGVVELLTGSRFDGRPSMSADSPPRTDFEAVKATAAEIQFVEQAFEWENMSFILYPYFWAGMPDDPQKQVEPKNKWEMLAQKWAELQQTTSADADFDRFLRAGSARVVLPARPGFEFPAELYTLFGTLWGGGPAPVPGDPLYLSIAREVRAQQQPPKDGEPGEWWEVRLPTTLVHLAPLETALPLTHTGAELPKP